MRFCCRHGPDVEWASARVPPPKMWSAAYPMRHRPVAMIGLALSAPPDGLTVTSSPRPSTRAQQQLLVGERGLQLGHLDRAVAESGRLGGDAGRRRVVEGPERRVVALGAMVEAGDVGRPLDELAGPVAAWPAPWRPRRR